MFIENKGEDPRPDCPVLFITSNQVRPKPASTGGAAEHVPDDVGTPLQQSATYSSRAIAPGAAPRSLVSQSTLSLPGNSCSWCPLKTGLTFCTTIVCRFPFRPVTPSGLARKNFVEVVASSSYGNSTVGDAPLSDWLQPGNITTTLFAGLFRPVAPVRKLVADATAQLYPSTGQVRACV